MVEKFIRLRCLGDGNGESFLRGNVDTGQVSLGPGSDPGALWWLRSAGHSEWTLTCWAQVDAIDNLFPVFFDEPRYLDGNVFNGQVQLVKVPTPPFSGTRWFSSQAGDYRTFTCLGDGGSYDAPRLLDGWRDQGSVQLRTAAPQFTGTKWAVEEQL